MFDHFAGENKRYLLGASSRVNEFANGEILK